MCASLLRRPCECCSLQRILQFGAGPSRAVVILRAADGDGATGGIFVSVTDTIKTSITLRGGDARLVVVVGDGDGTTRADATATDSRTIIATSGNNCSATDENVAAVTFAPTTDTCTAILI